MRACCACIEGFRRAPIPVHARACEHIPEQQHQLMCFDDDPTAGALSARGHAGGGTLSAGCVVTSEDWYIAHCAL